MRALLLINHVRRVVRRLGWVARSAAGQSSHPAGPQLAGKPPRLKRIKGWEGVCANHVVGGGDGVVTAAFDVVVGNYVAEGFSESTFDCV